MSCEKKLVCHGKSLIKVNWHELVHKLSRLFLNVNIFLEFYKIAKDNLRKYPVWLNEAVIPKADDIQPGQSKHFSYNLQLAQQGQHFGMRRFSISENKILLFHHGVVVFSEVFMKWLRHSFIKSSWYYKAARINRIMMIHHIDLRASFAMIYIMVLRAGSELYIRSM